MTRFDTAKILRDLPGFREPERVPVATDDEAIFAAKLCCWLANWAGWPPEEWGRPDG